MKKITTLADLKNNESAKVINLLSGNHIRRRLQDIGLVKDTIVKAILISPSGDPIAYLIKGAIIAIRKEDANAVLVEYI